MKMKGKPTVAVLIPTFRPDKRFSRLLQMLQRQTYPVQQIIIMNTEESLWNDAGYEGIPGMEVHHVTRQAFDHGGTRRRGMTYVRTDVCICMTQDAVPADTGLVEALVNALFEECGPEDEFTAVAYARQLPDKKCRLIERYTRSFNYPEERMRKRLEDLPRLGIKTFFCSNVCAAYNMEYYNRLDGFVEHTIFNEDMIYAAQVMDAGYSIVYEPEARVIHSHNYSAMQQLRRNFDLAVSQVQFPEVFLRAKSEQEGIRMVKETARYLLSVHKPHLIPQLMIQSGFKYLGYQLGRHYWMLPYNLVLRLTMNPYYWKEK